MLLWIDIENEPQVQYLLPLAAACRRLGAKTVITARDYGATFELLNARNEEFHAIDAAYGASKSAKVRGLLRRRRALLAFFDEHDPPDALVCSSRAGVLAARRLGIPSYAISDYEYADLKAFRWARTTILFPNVIDAEYYRGEGFRNDQLVPFEGLKEDITFAETDLEAIAPADLGIDNTDNRVRVLVRPPADESHYYKGRSKTLYLEALRFLASEPSVVIVFAPRYKRQVADLDTLAFESEPVVLARPVPFVSLLKAVDAVLCSGGTMLREAAYLGIPAYSIFRSSMGGVDRYLESIGRATLLSSPDDLSLMKFAKVEQLSPLRQNPELVSEIAAIVMQEHGVVDAKTETT